MINYENITKEEVIEILNNLQKRKFIRVLDYPEGITIKIRPSLVTIASNGVEDWIDDYRKLFQGKKAGAMGDRAACINKMQEFMQFNPQFTKDIIIKATNRYINKITDYTYLMKADNFISKSLDNTKAGRRSELSSYCEEVAMNIGSVDNDERRDYGKSI